MLVPPIAAPMAALHTAVDDVRAVDPALIGDASLVASLEELRAVEIKAQALQARLLQEAESRDALAQVTGRSSKSFLVEELAMSDGEAGTRVRLARQLPTAPGLQAAFDSGDVSIEHARVILKALRQVPDHLLEVVEVELVKLARECPPSDVAKALDQILAMLGEETSAEKSFERRFGARGVGLDTTFGGFASLNGTLSPEVAEALGVALSSASAPCGAEDERTKRQRLHDALGDVANFYNAHHDLPADTGERPRVVVTIPLASLVDFVGARGGTFDSGIGVSPATARRLACDAELVPAVLGARGEVLDLGRASRTFSTAIKRAARTRDGGRCAYPRCRRRIAECHHIIHWANGGSSSLDNAAWLCTFHHWLAHEGGWTFWRRADGRYTWRSRDGREFTGDPRPHRSAA